eukprot:c24495_g2_i1 orf=790-2703(+)
MDPDSRDTRLADGRLGDDRPGPPNKLARTDTFPLRMQIHNNEILGSLVRSNSSVVSDCRLGCSPTSSSTSDGHAFLGSDGNYLADARMLRNDSMISYSGNTSRVAAYQQQQALPFRSSALMSAYGGGGVHEMERGGEGLLQQVVFTSNQLRELQLHALIFKHMVCGVNVPPELVLLVRTSVAALAGMTTGGSHLGSLGWGNYHLGYGNSVDPEPGRCRRTDGKKWRCARDVVPDQKYCERHMHRGRHRARKPPEPLTSSVSAPNPSSASTPRSAAGTSTPPTPSSASLHPSVSQLSGFQQQQSSASATASPNLGVKSFSANSSPSCGALSIGSSLQNSGHLQQQIALQAGAGVKDFRYINNDLSQEQTLFSDARGPALSGLSAMTTAVNNPLGAIQSRAQQHSFLGSGYEGGGGREPEGQPLRHFFDDWPRGRDPSSLTWPDMEGDQEQQQRANRSSSTTQLSISIPNMQGGTAGFGSNGSSPRAGKLALSPLKLSMSRGEEDPLGVEAATQMGLGVGLGVNESERQRQSSWVPIAWETSSVGGPLAEVLHSSSNTPRGGGGGGGPNPHNAAATNRSSAGLNLMDGWDGSPRSSPPTSSPTGVLQINATFGSFSSDNSTASSPRLAALNRQNQEPNM